jgi:hypothetical protein
MCEVRRATAEQCIMLANADANAELNPKVAYSILLPFTELRSYMLARFTTRISPHPHYTQPETKPARSAGTISPYVSLSHRISAGLVPPLAFVGMPNPTVPELLAAVFSHATPDQVSIAAPARFAELTLALPTRIQILTSIPTINEDYSILHAAISKTSPLTSTHNNVQGHTTLSASTAATLSLYGLRRYRHPLFPTPAPLDLTHKAECLSICPLAPSPHSCPLEFDGSSLALLPCVGAPLHTLPPSVFQVDLVH